MDAVFQGAVFIHNPVQMLGFTTHLVELLDGMINPDPRKRFTIAQACSWLYVLLQQGLFLCAVPNLVRKATTLQSRPSFFLTFILAQRLVS